MKFSIKDRIDSIPFAIKGITTLLKKEQNAKVHVFAAILVIMLSAFFKISSLEWMLVVVVIGLVFITEILNTAIERLADVVDKKWNPLIGEVKDYSAGAVLIATFIAIVVGVIVFIPKLWVIIVAIKG